MQYLREIETFVEVGFELGLFIIVMTIAIMQIVAPYARTIVQRSLLRCLAGQRDFRELDLLIRSSKAARSVLKERYPFLAKAMSPKLDLQWCPPRLLEHAQLGVSDRLLMRIIQNAAQSVVERPSRDPVSYAALTTEADDADRIGGIVVDAISASELAHSVQHAEMSSSAEFREGRVPSEVALEATAVRTSLAAAVDRKLDEAQVKLSVRWQLTGRLLAIAVGAMSAIYVALASGAISAAPILGLVALAPGVFVVLGAWYSGWMESHLLPTSHSENFHRPDRKSRLTLFRSLSLEITSGLMPIYGLLFGLGILRLASGNAAVSLFVFGGLAGLIASVIYDAAKVFARRR